MRMAQRRWPCSGEIEKNAARKNNYSHLLVAIGLVARISRFDDELFATGRIYGACTNASTHHYNSPTAEGFHEGVLRR